MVHLSQFFKCSIPLEEVNVKAKSWIHWKYLLNCNGSVEVKLNSSHFDITCILFKSKLFLPSYTNNKKRFGLSMLSNCTFVQLRILMPGIALNLQTLFVWINNYTCFNDLMLSCWQIVSDSNECSFCILCIITFYWNFIFPTSLQLFFDFVTLSFHRKCC